MARTLNRKVYVKLLDGKKVRAFEPGRWGSEVLYVGVPFVTTDKKDSKRRVWESNRETLEECSRRVARDGLTRSIEESIDEDGDICYLIKKEEAPSLQEVTA